MGKKSTSLETYKIEHARAEQLGINCRWLIDKIDEIFYALCPGKVGTWQQRAEMAVSRAKELSQENNKPKVSTLVRRTKRKIK
jgi:hypothetical protein